MTVLFVTKLLVHHNLLLGGSFISYGLRISFFQKSTILILAFPGPHNSMLIQKVGQKIIISFCLKYLQFFTCLSTFILLKLFFSLIIKFARNIFKG